MSPLHKKYARLAVALASRLAAGAQDRSLVELPEGAWDRATRLVRQTRRAQLRGWQLAAHQLRVELRYALGALQADLATSHARLPAIVAPALRTAGAHDLYRDLVELDQEFAEVEFDRASLRVTTEPVVLEGVYLGPFEIRLELARLASVHAPYRIVARDPHPAESRESVTHPHVMDEVLCEGDGRQAIRQALAQGRLLDFFTLVAGVLRSYNPESPFVELALWHGQSCSDCGACGDDLYSCYLCDASVCSECELFCTACEEACCSSCSGPCAGCDSLYCTKCLERCGSCRTRLCADCLDERCPNCHEDDEDNDQGSAAAAAGAALESHGLGQAALPA